MDNEQMVHGLIQLKQAPGFPALILLINQRIDTARNALEDAALVDMNTVCLCRGELGAYRFLLNLFDQQLELIKNAQQADRKARDAGITLGESQE